MVRSHHHARQAGRRRQGHRPPRSSDRSTLLRSGEADGEYAPAHGDPRRDFLYRADGALVRGIQRRSRDIRGGARAARGDQRSPAPGERHHRSAQWCRRQADIHHLQPASGARRRQGAGAARPEDWRTQRRGAPAARIQRDRNRWFACGRCDSETKGTRGLARRQCRGGGSRPNIGPVVKFTKRTGTSTMDEIVTEHTGSVLRIQFNRPTKRNAMTSAMYLALAGIFNKAATDDDTRVVLWHGAGDSFCAGNDIEDFLKNPPGPGESPQAGLMNAFVNFDKPIVVAVHGAAIGGGTTMLTHCDFIYAGESAKFQMPFINLAVVPEFGSSCAVPARIGHLRAAELILLGGPFDARRAAELGLVTEVISDKDLLAKATETARKLATKPAAALQASKRLMKQPFREQLKAAMKAENEEFSAQVRSEDAKEAFSAFLEKRKPDFTRSVKSQATA